MLLYLLEKKLCINLLLFFVYGVACLGLSELKSQEFDQHSIPVISNFPAECEKHRVAVVRAQVNDYVNLEEKLLHECGVSFVRLRKPISYYIQRYEDPAWGIKKLLSLMEKQRNRGQDGAGIATVQFNMPAGQEYLQHIRSASENAIESILLHVTGELAPVKDVASDAMREMQIKRQSPFVAEVFLGHVRYTTHAGAQLKYCQPFVRSHGVTSRQFALAGNFNMTNIAELFRQLQEWGLSPNNESNIQVILDMIAHYLDKEYKRIGSDLLSSHSHGDRVRNNMISQQIDLVRVMQEASEHWDGGYVFCGILGNGDAFICRDPAGIRPGYYFYNDDVVAAASEKVALMDVFDLQQEDVFPIKPGHVVVVKQNGEITEKRFAPECEERHCVFERIYFSRPHDRQIYEERKALGRQLAARVLAALGQDIDKAIFTYAPNSSLAAFQGLVEEINHLLRKPMINAIEKQGVFDLEQIQKLAQTQVKAESLIAKNQRLRTFINPDGVRKNPVAELYEVTKGVVGPENVLVVVDDSIVRGMTLKESLIKKLIGLNPKKILIVSSAPPVLYPDYYGIDISQIEKFIAFQAALAWHNERNGDKLLEEVRQLCIAQKDQPNAKLKNYVKKIYEGISLEELSQKIAQLLLPASTEWKGELQVLYQDLNGLHQAIASAKGDWYFSGEFPTPGGYRVLNNSFIKWCTSNE